MTTEAYVYIPDEVRDKIPKLYTTENDTDPTVWIKLFTPDSSWTWYITEYDGEDLCFGLVAGHETELGYFSLAEIASVHGPLGLRIERDIWFTPKPLSTVKA